MLLLVELAFLPGYSIDDDGEKDKKVDGIYLNKLWATGIGGEARNGKEMREEERRKTVCTLPTVTHPLASMLYVYVKQRDYNTI